MMKIYSICNQYPDLEFKFKSVGGELQISISKDAKGFISKRDYIASPYTRDEIIQTNMEEIAKEVQENWCTMVSQRNR